METEKRKWKLWMKLKLKEKIKNTPEKKQEKSENWKKKLSSEQWNRQQNGKYLNGKLEPAQKKSLRKLHNQVVWFLFKWIRQSLYSLLEFNHFFSYVLMKYILFTKIRLN